MTVAVRRLAVEDRRRALVGAAIRVIAREGVAGATTRAIVAEADMALASFHYAFTSRDELLEAVITEVTSQERLAAESRFTPLAPAPGSSGARPSMESVVHAGLDAYLDLLAADPLREQALLELSLFGLRTPGFGGAVRGQYEAYYRAATATLRTAAHVTHSRWTIPLEDAARILVTITDGLTTTWLADRDTRAARATIRVAARVLASLAVRVHEPDEPDEPDDVDRSEPDQPRPARAKEPTDAH